MCFTNLQIKEISAEGDEETVQYGCVYGDSDNQEHSEQENGIIEPNDSVQCDNQEAHSEPVNIDVVYLQTTLRVVLF